VSVCPYSARPLLLHRRRLSDKFLSDFGADSSSTSTTTPGAPMPHRQGLLPGVRRIDYFRFDTETTTWIEDPGFDYFLDIDDFRHFTSYRRSFSDVRRETPTLSQPYL
jgi:hypothetical protein